MNHVLFLAAFVGLVSGGSLKQESLKTIAEKINSLHTTWKAETNLPDDLTISSFAKLLGAKESEVKLPLRSHQLADIEIPEEFDSRLRWPNCPSISHIRDQGNCGSCWAVAVAGAFTDRVCIATNGSFTLPLSDEELLSCCDECGFGCNGGFPESAWNFLSTNGLVTGGDYNTTIGCQPYSIQACEHHAKGNLPPCSSLPAGKTPDCKQTCTNPDYETSFDADHRRVLAQGGYRVLRDVREIQREVLTHGPVEASFSVHTDFVTYKSGVYQYVSGGRIGGHAVRLIGWGTENGTPYWLVANSWNTHWGDGGLFKIIRGKDECGIESGITAGLPDV